MEAGKRTIRDIFNRGRNLEIPFFQRSYVWDVEQWQRFLDAKMDLSVKVPTVSNISINALFLVSLYR